MAERLQAALHCSQAALCTTCIQRKECAKEPPAAEDLPNGSDPKGRLCAAHPHALRTPCEVANSSGSRDPCPPPMISQL